MSKASKVGLAFVTMLSAGTAGANEVEFKIEPNKFEPTSSTLGSYAICKIYKEATDKTKAPGITEFCKASAEAWKQYEITDTTCKRDENVRKLETQMNAIKEGWDRKKISEQESQDYRANQECGKNKFKVYLEAENAAFKKSFPNGLTFKIGTP